MTKTMAQDWEQQDWAGLKSLLKKQLRELRAGESNSARSIIAQISQQPEKSTDRLGLLLSPNIKDHPAYKWAIRNDSFRDALRDFGLAASKARNRKERKDRQPKWHPSEFAELELLNAFVMCLFTTVIVRKTDWKPKFLNAGLKKSTIAVARQLLTNLSDGASEALPYTEHKTLTSLLDTLIDKLQETKKRAYPGKASGVSAFMFLVTRTMDIKEIPDSVVVSIVDQYCGVCRFGLSFRTVQRHVREHLTESKEMGGSRRTLEILE